MPVQVARDCTARTLAHPLADPGVIYEPWYLKRWHCLPEGYLSDRSIALYDRVIRRLYAVGRHRALTRRLAEECRDRGVRSLLEVGPGPGLLLSRLARRLPGVDLRAADLSPYCVDSARRRLAGVLFEATAIEARVVHADARALPWSAGSFDAVVASHVLGHVPAGVASGIADEAARVLRPGGVLLLVEHAWHHVPLSRFAPLNERRLAGGALLLRTLTPIAT
jgi:ubiquinone/menaquinone biosynthesis C-methylase UbiE